MACSSFCHFCFIVLTCLTFSSVVSSWQLQSSLRQSDENQIPPDKQVERAIQLLNQQDYRGAVNLLKSAAKSFEQMGAHPETARVWNMLGVAHRRMAEYDESVVWLNKALRLSEQIKDEEVMAEVLNNLGILNAELGEYSKAESYLTRSLALAESQKADPASRINMLLNLALAEMQLQKLDKAREAIEQAERLGPSIADSAQRDDLLSKIKARLADLPKPGEAELQKFEAWEVRGFGITACPCATPCPCRSMATPTTGSCEEANFVHFDKGRYGATDLSGLSFVMLMASYKGGDRWSTLYINRSATDQQIDALQNILRDMSTSKRAHFERVRRVDLSYTKSADRKLYTIDSPSLLRIKARLRTDSRGRPSQRTAAFDPWSNVIAYMDNLEYRFDDAEAGKRWDYSGRQANFRSFVTTQQAYRRGEMIAQYPESKGFFNARQLEIIRKQKLPMLKSYPRPGKGGSCCSGGACSNPLIVK
jgi:tetratricopeptide (TPR) repeat protein